jgi:hypothetical protein
MKVKLFLVIALTAASLVLVLGGIKQAYAHNLIIAAAENTTVQMAVLNEQQKRQLDKRDQGRKVEEIEPAAGDE